MLLRTQPDAGDLERDDLEALRAEPERPAVRRVERRKADRRGMDALRDEALRNLITKVEDKNFGGLRDRVRSSRGLGLSRVALVMVALVAGGVAAFLATQREQPVAQPAPEVITQVIPVARVLVAKELIGIGQRLSPGSLAWEDWPLGAVRPEYITSEAAPDAITAMAGSVARVELYPGEPIREQKLAEAGRGYLSASLDSGSRGVSVSVTAVSASGGFIVPNDHVDVVLTRPSSAGQVSDIILHNVRVLAINGNAGTSGASDEATDAEAFSDDAIATLELDPSEAEVIINATSIGTLALLLRPATDEPRQAERSAANQAIRISSPFWLNNAGGGGE